MMKQVVLKSIRLLNFKGIRDINVRFNEDVTNIMGKNKAGKSTVFDAFLWLLFSKDQFDRKDHEIKTLDPNNEPIHQLDHEVEGVFIVEGKEEVLKRIYKEIWTKKRGTAKAEFTGHETIYFWNDVPCKMAEYQAKVSAIISEGMFKLITNPAYFNSLPWDKRRSCLLDMAGTITNDQVFQKIATAGNDYSTLLMVLNSGKSAADYKKEIAVKKLKIKRELEEIPARINEAERNMPVAVDFAGIEQMIVEKKAAIASIDEMLPDAAKAQASQQKELMNKQTSLHAYRTDLSNLRFRIKSEIQAGQNESSNDIYQAEIAVRNNNNLVREKEQSLTGRLTTKETLLSSIKSNEEKLASLREEWGVINSETFVFDDTSANCPTCHQALPSTDIEKKKAELLASFNSHKSNRLGEKVNAANRIKADSENLNKSLALVTSNIQELEEEIKNLKDQLPKLKMKLDTLKIVESKKASFDIEAAVTEKLATDPDALHFENLIANLEAEIRTRNDNPSTTDNADLKQQKSSLQNEVEKLQKSLATKDTIANTQKRIAELKRQEEKLNQELADFELQEFEIEKYNKAKMDILESKINSRFTLVKFKLFERQINQAEVECCECLVNGVPYSALNTESKLNAGLDIINVLCDHYKVTAPVFIDNRESVSSIIHTKSQIINLIVNPAFSTLHVEAA